MTRNGSQKFMISITSFLATESDKGPTLKAIHGDSNLHTFLLKLVYESSAKEGYE
jgi:hypothetical protein